MSMNIGLSFSKPDVARLYRENAARLGRLISNAIARWTGPFPRDAGQRMTDENKRAAAVKEFSKALFRLLEQLTRADVDHTASIEQLRSADAELRAFLASTSDWYFDAFEKMSARLDALEAANYRAADPSDLPRRVN